MRRDPLLVVTRRSPYVLVGDDEMLFYRPSHLVLRPVAGVDDVVATGLDDLSGYR